LQAMHHLRQERTRSRRLLSNLEQDNNIKIFLAFKKLIPGTAVQITYKGTEKTKSGMNVKTFEVRLLNVARMSIPVPETITKQPQLEQRVEEKSKPKFKNSFMSTEYWTKANELKLTHEEGMDHLAEFGNDFEEALAMLTSPY